MKKKGKARQRQLEMDSPVTKGKAIRSRTPGAMQEPSHLTLITEFPYCEGLFVEEMELVDVTSISWGEHGVT